MPPPRRPIAGFWLLLSLVLLCAAAKAVLYDTLDPDCFWHLRVGRQLLDEGIHSLRDTLSFASMQEPWTPYSWLAEIAMCRLWDFGGFRGAILVAAMLNATTLLFVALAARQAVSETGRSLAVIFATVFAAILSLAYLSFRPVTLAIALLAAVAWLIVRDRRQGERSAAVWLVPPITALLVNIHLFALLVPAWFACLFAGAALERLAAARRAGLSSRAQDDIPDQNRRVVRYLVLTFASTLACLLTPMLPGVLATIAHYQLHDPMVAADVIGEMRPFCAGAAGKVSLALTLVFFICVIRSRRQLRPGDICWLALSSLLLLRLGRMAPLFAIVAAPLFAATLPALSDNILARPILKAAVAAILSLGLYRIATDFPSPSTDLSAWLNRHGPDAPGYPTDAAQFVDAHVRPTRGRIINEFNWGGYLAWRLGDHYQVFLDGRTQLYSPAFWRETYLGDESTRRQALTPIDADAAILPVGRSAFRQTLIDLGWRPIRRDDRAEVLIPPTANLADLDAN